MRFSLAMYFLVSLVFMGCQTTDRQEAKVDSTKFTKRSLECKLVERDLTAKTITWDTDSDYRIRTRDPRHGFSYLVQVNIESESDAEATIIQTIKSKKVKGLSGLKGKLSKTGKTMHFSYKAGINSEKDNHRLFRFQITKSNKILRLEHRYARNFADGGLSPHDGHFVFQEASVRCAVD